MQALNPATATDKIRKLACDDQANWVHTAHFKTKLQERDLIIDDARHLLKFGYVYEAAKKSTQNGLWKYKVEGTTPNTHNRRSGIVVIPDFVSKIIKIVTIYWKDV